MGGPVSLRSVSAPLVGGGDHPLVSLAASLGVSFGEGGEKLGLPDGPAPRSLCCLGLGLR